MAANEQDRDFAKLKYTQALESMRHVQKLEATEMGFVMAIYGVVIAALIGAPQQLVRCRGFWGVASISLPTAGILCYHFGRRRKSFYRHAERLKQACAVLGEPCPIRREQAGFATRVGLILIATLAVILLAS